HQPQEPRADTSRLRVIAQNKFQREQPKILHVERSRRLLHRHGRLRTECQGSGESKTWEFQTRENYVTKLCPARSVPPPENRCGNVRHLAWPASIPSVLRVHRRRNPATACWKPYLPPNARGQVCSVCMLGRKWQRRGSASRLSGCRRREVQ